MYNNPPTQGAVDALVSAVPGITVLYHLSLIKALAVLLPTSLLPDQVVGILQGLPDVQQISDDVLTFVDPICPTNAPPPASESYHWGPQQIKVPAVDQQWPRIKGSAGVTVAVLDTGIQRHPDLAGRIAPEGYNAITGGDPVDDHGHGTAMAGIITAAKNRTGIIGVAGVESSIDVAAVKVLDKDGVGYLSGVIDGMRWVWDNPHIRLVNMSFGFSFSNQSDENPLMKAVQELYLAGIIMVASAGNSCPPSTALDDGGGDSCGPAASCSAPLRAVTAPARYQDRSWVIGVGATTFGQQGATYSLPGAVWAPGGRVDSRELDNGQIFSTSIDPPFYYGRGHGTSHAAAHVTGAAALALQIRPGLCFGPLRDLLQDTAQSEGARPIDVDKMLEELLRLPAEKPCGEKL